jgi:hypothetical protein
MQTLAMDVRIWRENDGGDTQGSSGKLAENGVFL